MISKDIRRDSFQKPYCRHCGHELWFRGSSWPREGVPVVVCLDEEGGKEHVCLVLLVKEAVDRNAS
jgi:hypothetical protein